MDDASGGHGAQAVEQLPPRRLDLCPGELRLCQPRRGHIGVADELHDDAVVGPLDRIRDRGAGRPRQLEHRHLLDRPHTLDDVVSVIGLVRDGTSVTTREEPAAPIRRVVPVAGRLIESELAQLAARRAARPVSLVDEERGRAAGVSALDQEDLRFLAGFQGAERGLVVRLVEQPCRRRAWRGD